MISAGAVRGVIGGMIDDYSRQTGIKFKFTTGPTGLLRDTIASGAPADLIIASAPLMAELEKTGKMMPGSRGRSRPHRTGRRDPRTACPRPTFRRRRRLKQTLLKAQSIAHTDPKLGGTSVIHLMKIADGFGIKDDVTARRRVNVDRRQRCGRQGRQGQSRHRDRARSARSDVKGAKLAAPLPGDAAALTGLCRRDPDEAAPTRRTRARSSLR